MPDASHHFPATRWTLLQCLREGSEEDVKVAMEALCKAYWSPLYVVARRHGLQEHDAEDLVQGFFESVLEGDTLLKADQSQGKLRTLLLNSFEYFRIKIWRDGMTKKRGGNIEVLSFSFPSEAEERYLQMADEIADVETIYNREWARNVLARSLSALREDHLAKAQAERFDMYAIHLTQAGTDETRRNSARQAGVSENTFRQAVFRLRRRYREKIEDELAVTLGTRDPEVIRCEMMELFKAFK
jgi:DNA-directed RNA polymerase specialized sigma24 family protein